MSCAQKTDSCLPCRQFQVEREEGMEEIAGQERFQPKHSMALGSR